MRNSDLHLALSVLSIEERIDLAQELWDSVARDKREQNEIVLRLAEHRADAQAIVPWIQVKASLKP